MDMNRNLVRSSRKRKRKHSSVSSCLVPATFVVHTEVGDNGCDKNKAPVSQGFNAELDDNASQSSPSSPHTSAIKPISPQKLNKDYERRPRNRTRENRYELKQGEEAKKRKKKKDEGAPKKERKRRRREKSGAALMHGFTAPNVAHDRLTVRRF